MLLDGNNKLFRIVHFEIFIKMTLGHVIEGC